MQVKLLKKPENILLISTTILSFLFFLWGINSWKFAFAGDDWPFYIFDVKLLVSPIFPDPFSFSGVYGTHSQMISIYQTIYMIFLGNTNFAWRLSNVILIFPLSYFFYRLVKYLFSKDVAVLATILMQCSFYLANFFKIGYDNPQSLTLFVICLYLAAKFGKKPELRTGMLLGTAVGISFYNYFGASFPLFIWPFLLPVIKELNRSKIRWRVAATLLMYLVFLIPAAAQITKLIRLHNSLVYHSSLYLNNTILYDFILFYKNNDYFYNHYVVGPYLDIVTQIFCLIGTIVVLLRFRKHPYLYVLLSYIAMVLFLGSTSTGSTSPVTRGIFLLPYGFIFAGLGLNLVRKIIKNNFASFAFCWIILLSVATVNVYQSQIGVFTSKHAGYTGMALIIRSLMEDREAKKPVILVLSPSLSINIYTWMLPYMRLAYRLNDIPFTITRPAHLTCKASVKNSLLLVLKQDSTAREKLNTFNCGHPQISILSPTITFY